MISKIKFCGIRTVREARNAEKLSVDAIGLVRTILSARYITRSRAMKICRNVPMLMKVGVFVNDTLSFVCDTIKCARINLLQFCGRESTKFCDSISYRFNIPYIRVIHIRELSHNIINRINRMEGKYIFLDSLSGYGGNGMTFDWNRMDMLDNKYIIVGGGLSYKNVGALIRNYKPHYVDVSSGIEEGKRKSFALMKKFVKAVRR
ncbi:phosphoribosylanthranilate isomerase [Candidatus Vidania fulgoroideorum]